MTRRDNKVNYKIFCFCGCGEKIWKYDSTWRERRFIQGHNGRLQLSRPIYKEGYRLIKMPNHHRADSLGYVREHIVVLEQKLGRELLANEDSHHINGKRDDNRPSNLTNLIHGGHSALTNTKDMTNRKCIECDKSRTVNRHWYRVPEGPGLWCHACRARYRWRQKKFFSKLKPLEDPYPSFASLTS